MYPPGNALYGAGTAFASLVLSCSAPLLQDTNLLAIQQEFHGTVLQEYMVSTFSTGFGTETIDLGA